MDELVAGVPAVALVIALTEAVKRVAGADLAARWYPLVALGWSALLVGLAGYAGATAWYETVVAVLVVATAAMGLYSGGKAIVGGSAA